MHASCTQNKRQSFPIWKQELQREKKRFSQPPAPSPKNKIRKINEKRTGARRENKDGTKNEFFPIRTVLNSSEQQPRTAILRENHP